MHIVCFGLNHQTAPLLLLERMHLSGETLQAALARCGCGRDGADHDLLELTILSTCNRVETYALSRDQVSTELEALLAEASGVSRDEFAQFSYGLHGSAAAEHLHRVACGLESMVLGEPQILGQVAEAHAQSLQQDSTGPVLTRLFESAIHAGKRARHETRIGSNPATASSVAVHFIASIVQPLEQASVLIIGAGEMAELAVEAMRKRGVHRLTVMNRTVSRAQELANHWAARAVSFEALHAELKAADIVITSTGAPHAILHRQTLEPLAHELGPRRMVILDIAVPRNVDPEVGRLPNVHLYDLEDLNRHLRGALSDREKEVPAVEALIREELDRFEAWLKLLEVKPLIAALYQRAEAIAQEEVQRTLPRLGALEVDDQVRLEAMTRAIVKKILHSPVSRLKEESLNGNAARYALLARKLFQLPPTGSAMEGDEEASA